MTTNELRMEERRLAKKYRYRAKRAKSDNMKERLTVCAEVCRIEGWDVKEYIRMLQTEINSF